MRFGLGFAHVSAKGEQEMISKLQSAILAAYCAFLRSWRGVEYCECGEEKVDGVCPLDVYGRMGGSIICKIFWHWWQHDDSGIDWECFWCDETREGNRN